MNTNTKNIIFSITLFLLVGSVFVFYPREVWFDESFSILRAQQSVNEIVVPGDVHSPSYYLYLHFWGKLFGFSLISLRLSSLLVGILAVIYLYKLFKTIYPDDNIGWVLVIIMGWGRVKI